MKLKPAAAETCLDLMQGLFDEDQIPEKMISDFKEMLDVYLIHTEDRPKARKRVYKSYEDMMGFLMTLCELFNAEFMEGVYNAREEMEKEVF